MLSAICFDLDQIKILSSGNRIHKKFNRDISLEKTKHNPLEFHPSRHIHVIVTLQEVISNSCLKASAHIW